ncbi:uncharacterized protein LOC123561948 [Mercenaria mercenaria]|uniref:uncharacterized protein LOC123561948 n=1 Tax=Mercenaria mercenaria TaxID=6596 RepID=UPI00234E9D45|nr:uncharacterized protein LOC123561948 [Mercenaria mercenaria]
MSRKLVPYSDSSSSDESSSESDDDEKYNLKKHRLSLSKKKIILTGRKERRQKLKEKQHESRQMKHNEKREELVSNYYNIKERMERKSRKFKTQSKVYDVTFRSYDKPFEFTHDLFNSMVHEMKDRCNAMPRDKVRISITHPKLNLGIHVPFDDVSNVTGETLLNEIERVVQSNEEFKIHDGQMQAEITHISMPEGSSKSRRNMHYGSHVSIEHMTKLKRSIIQIDNSDDSMCLARSIVVGMCYAQKSDSNEWKKRWNAIRKSKLKLQEREAQTLLDSVGIKYNQACGIEEYQKIQDTLYPEYIIKIHAQHAKSDLLFTAPKMTKQSKVVHVYFHSGHFDTIISIKGFLGYSYYCEYCGVGYKCKEQHKCNHICDCYSSNICEKGVSVQCKECYRWFRSAECFQKHKDMQGKSKKNICKSVWVCKTCGQIVVGTRKNHLCAGVKKCKYCKKIVEPSHDCYIPKYTSPKKEELPDVPFIFYDFECRFDTGEHIPNFCVAQRACGDCIRKPLSECCMRCDEVPGGREVIFRGDHTLSSFCTWLFNPIHKGATVIAHNAQGYDAQFILRYLVTHGTVKPKLIMNGSKIIMMEAHGVRLIDSMSFISMPLASFPKTFGLTEMAKGWFPFWANTHEFQEYVGPYLPLEYYKPGSMKPESRKYFLKWYNEKIKNEEIFDFQKEMEKYCRSDVDILRRGCGEFRYQLMSSDQIDPFLEACTLAQACNKAWRKNSMPENSFGIISDAGYPNKTRYSIKAIRWIQGIAYKHDTKIQHALNGGEQQIGPYFVDGFDKERKTVYEFLGCWTHGCKECYPKRETKNPYSMQTMETLYKNTFKRFDVLQQQGYNIRYIWECQFNNSYCT